MYAISRSAGLTLPIRDRETVYYENGTVKAVKPAVSINFQHSGTVPEYAKDAVTHLADWGRGIGLDEDPFERCGSFDSDYEAERNHWDAETKALVEKVLRDGSGTLYVVADPPKIGKPWPNYDSLTGDDEAETAFLISKRVSEDGYDPKAVRQYEHENADRPLVVESLDYLVETAEADTLGVIQA